jgi:excisionase family DNA binding protein
MLLKVKEAALTLNMELHHVYYLLTMGEIEAVKIGKAWRLAPEAVDEYAERLPEIKNRKSSGYFIYPGDGGFLFSCLLDRLPPDPQRQAPCMARRRGQLVHCKKRSSEVLLQKLKSLGQLDLFAG